MIVNVLINATVDLDDAMIDESPPDQPTILKDGAGAAIGYHLMRALQGNPVEPWPIRTIKLIEVWERSSTITPGLPA